jgi:group I intron endonuclease
MGCLYKLTFPNGKCYVGITDKTAEKRFAQHCKQANESARGVRNETPLYRAIRKYGPLSMSVETLAVSPDWQLLCRLEIAEIAARRTTDPTIGYNVTAGGQGPKGMRHTEESREKMRAAAIGRTFSDETRRKISAAGTGRKMSQIVRALLHTDAAKRKRNISISKKQKRTNTSGCVGVSFDVSRMQWSAKIMVSRRTINLGRFDLKDDAIAARMAAEEKYLSNTNNAEIAHPRAHSAHD